MDELTRPSADCGVGASRRSEAIAKEGAEQAPSRAWYYASFAEFLASDKNLIMGALAFNSVFADDASQKQAWLAEIEFLQAHLQGCPARYSSI